MARFMDDFLYAKIQRAIFEGCIDFSIYWYSLEEIVVTARRVILGIRRDGEAQTLHVYGR